MPKNSITQDELKAMLNYNPESGDFTWRVNRRGHAGKSQAGMLAGSRRPDGRLIIAINGKKYLASRLAWFFSYGTWPNPTVDHINGDSTDDRLANLREADFQQQVQNRKVQKNSASGYPGVYWYKASNRWQAKIKHNRKERSLGYYLDLFDAIAARMRAERELHTHRREV